jgi:hypothetical protein
MCYTRVHENSMSHSASGLPFRSLSAIPRFANSGKFDGCGIGKRARSRAQTTEDDRAVAPEHSAAEAQARLRLGNGTSRSIGIVNGPSLVSGFDFWIICNGAVLNTRPSKHGRSERVTLPPGESMHVFITGEFEKDGRCRVRDCSASNSYPHAKRDDNAWGPSTSTNRSMRFCWCLDEALDATAIYEADRELVIAALTAPGSRSRNERGALGVGKSKSIG